MKKIFLFTAFVLFSVFSYSQTISPATTSEYCPQVPYTFTLSITGAAGAVTANGDPAGEPYAFIEPNVTTTATPVYDNSGNVTSTTVQIHVIFAAVQPATIAQGFRLSYFDKDNNLKYTPYYIFNKVKTIPGAPALNVSSFTAGYCDLTPLSISFTPISYVTANTSTTGSSNSAAYKPITKYEYAVPAGWKVNSTTSTDPDTYIQGTSTATITPDGTDGDGGSIKVRAVGECSDQGPISAIPISRPGFSLTGPDDVCATNAVFSATNLPTGASVAWQVGNGISIVSSTSSTVTVKSNGAFNGVTTISGTVTIPCSTTTYAVSKSVNVGVVQIDLLSASNNSSSTSTNSLCPTTTQNSVTLTIFPGARVYSLTINIYGVNTNGTIITSGYTTRNLSWPNGFSVSQTVTNLSLPITYNGFYKIVATAYNSCGTATSHSLFAQQSCSTGGGGQLKIASNATQPSAIQATPNPANSSFTLQLKSFSSPLITIFDIAGRPVFKKKAENAYQEVINTSSIPSGTYFVEVSDGVNKVVQKIVVAH